MSEDDRARTMLLAKLASGERLSVADFRAAAASITRGRSNGRLYVVDVSTSHGDALRVRLPTSSVWLELPAAAVESITAVGAADPGDPTQWFTLVQFRPEFERLHASFALISSNAANRRALDGTPEPCPVTGDDFLAEPGRLSNIGGAPPPAGTYTRIRLATAADVKQRVLIKQGNRVVARFYGDFSDPRREACFDSDGSDIAFEFQQCSDFADGSHAWAAYTNYIDDQSAAPEMRFLLSSGSTSAEIAWGPSIQRPPPPIELHVDGRVQCGGFLFKVATSYAFAWTTFGPNRDGPRAPVPNLSVTLGIPCREFNTAHSGQNVSDVVASEQFRGIGVPVCCDIVVTAEATLPDGTRLRKQTKVREP